jgi:acyl carrier protein
VVADPEVETMAQGNEAITERIRDLVAEVLRVDPKEVTPDRPFDELAETDSLTLAEIATALDVDFSIHIETPKISGARTVSDLVNLVEQVLEARQDAPG